MIRSVLLAVYGIALIALALRSLKEQRLRERYVLLFVGLSLPFLSLSLWPDAIVALSGVLMIEKATLLVLMVSGFLILVVFELLSLVSVQERKLVRLAQDLAILNEAVTGVSATAAQPRT